VKALIGHPSLTKCTHPQAWSTTAPGLNPSLRKPTQAAPFEKQIVAGVVQHPEERRFQIADFLDHCFRPGYELSRIHPSETTTLFKTSEFIPIRSGGSVMAMALFLATD
jgi:hypothetical protein